MAETAESLAEQYKLTRKEVDEVAVASQQRAKQRVGRLRVPGRSRAGDRSKVKGKEVEFRADEHMRPATTLEILSGAQAVLQERWARDRGQRVRASPTAARRR